MDTLLETVRGEIAACIEKGIPEYPFAEAARLNLSSQQAMLQYGQKRNWSLDSDNRYQFAVQENTSSGADFPSSELAQQAVEYARHLEMIV
ncbi:26S proteasome non-ATPase regulatory subunit 8 [Eumeta japonica]|uniref:26S proteasome non-ATPase regulatory subunit 8 n=1 Tax=Eumeta variegata TaxID=151549 RepID=A0A4C1TKQ3_EUMVA|nr:26S proteasome non-ATPase regulatory subunit 8 [Eumeta japonica]